MFRRFACIYSWPILHFQIVSFTSWSILELYAMYEFQICRKGRKWKLLTAFGKMKVYNFTSDQLLSNLHSIVTYPSFETFWMCVFNRVLTFLLFFHTGREICVHLVECYRNSSKNLLNFYFNLYLKVNLNNFTCTFTPMSILTN